MPTRRPRGDRLGDHLGDRPEMRRLPNTLAEAEVGRLFGASQGHRLHALWVLLATTGVRLGEALGLLWSDILGDSTISLTLDTYSHVAPALHAEVATHMQAMFT